MKLFYYFEKVKQIFLKIFPVGKVKIIIKVKVE